LRNENGIYFSGAAFPVSYPEYGNDIFFTVEDESYWFSHRNRCIIEMIRKFRPAGSLFFDIGGGNGFVSKTIQDSGFDAVLVEPGINGVVNARKRGIKNIICASFQDIGLEPGSVPAVGLFDVLEHIMDDAEFLRMINGYMEPGGDIFITVPSYGFLWSDEDVEAGHFRRYNAVKLEKLLEDCGFRIEYSTYMFAFLVLPILLFRVIPFKMGFIRGRKDLKDRESEHKIKFGPAQRIIEAFLGVEARNIGRMKKNASGSSCMIVARKI
jgi:SAM-dependent methyltransferase